MARYIDADAYEQKLADKNIFFPALFKNELDDMPTADVVPRVELDAMRGAANSYKMHYEKAKTEVAREIFGDVKKAIKEEVRDYCRGFESMETPEMQEYYKTKQNTAIYLYMKIDHLEKKYTEEKKDENQN